MVRFFILLLSVLSPLAFGQGGLPYTVEAGDTLSAIARRNGLELSALMAFNGLSSDLIYVGQRLRLPPTTETNSLRFHRVEIGETIAEIARRYGSSVELIEALNPDSSTRRAGGQLRVPAVPGRVVTAQAGESLLDLALRYGYGPADLADLNALESYGDLAEPLFIPDPEPPRTTSSRQTRFSLLNAQFSRLGRAGALLATFEPETDGYLWPLAATGRISSPFGWRSLSVNGNRFHAGLDIAAPSGTPILATRRGRVSRATWGGAYGYVVYLSHADGSETRYAHMQRIDVRVGDIVRQGEPLGLVGNTGASTGPHLHFELRFRARAVDPLGYLRSP